ncbi:leucyl aminopeptidase [Sinimarinibacterium thermocellulolyticum]|uniref:Probable cytosol aminopeptidase n=1 Tax=Sinimarinibacterium thermocellulolyticum TaxID=3170016 RepID=A0ABV2A5I7_9GAMM
MDYFVKSGTPEKQRVACLIVGVFERRSPTAPAAAVDEAGQGAISAVMRRGDMDGKLGTTLILHDVPGIFADRVMLVGLGRERSFDEAAFRKAIAASARALRTTGAIDAASYLTHVPVKGRDCHWAVTQAVLTTEDVFYRFDECRGEKARAEISRPKTERYTFDVPRRADLPRGERGLAEGIAIAKGVKLAKDLGNLPGNICTPSYLAEQARKLAGGGSIQTKVLEQSDMERLGMGALLSVAKGSRQPPKLIVTEYLHGPKGDKPVVLVGKGLTFDAGGISIKPAAAMDEMKFDMCGGAGVLGTMAALAELKLPLNVVGIIPAAENLPDGAANKPGDIVTSMAGITIEVLNTDAEGRLILCDALTYAERTYDPAICIDMATLTGACVVALGAHASGLFSNTPSLARALLAAGEHIGDRAWELPLWPEYDEQIRSEFADVANIATKGAREAGAIIGAVFLQRFAKQMKWAHLDIAGTAWTGKKATGRPVPLLVQYLLDLATRRNE